MSPCSQIPLWSRTSTVELESSCSRFIWLSTRKWLWEANRLNSRWINMHWPHCCSILTSFRSFCIYCSYFLITMIEQINKNKRIVRPFDSFYIYCLLSHFYFIRVYYMVFMRFLFVLKFRFIYWKVKIILINMVWTSSEFFPELLKSLGALFLWFFLKDFSKKLMRQASMRNKITTKQVRNDRFGTNLGCYSGIIFSHLHHGSCNSEGHCQ